AMRSAPPRLARRVWFALARAPGRRRSRFVDASAGRSVAFVVARKRALLHVVPILRERLRHLRADIGVPPHESRPELRENAEHVRRDEDLSVAARARADADRRDRKRFGHPPRELRRDLLEHDREYARVLEGFRVRKDALGLLGRRAARLVRAELVDRLRRQAEMTHHGYARVHDAPDRRADVL